MATCPTISLRVAPEHQQLVRGLNARLKTEPGFTAVLQDVLRDGRAPTVSPALPLAPATCAAQVSDDDKLRQAYAHATGGKTWQKYPMAVGGVLVHSEAEEAAARASQAATPAAPAASPARPVSDWDKAAAATEGLIQAAHNREARRETAQRLLAAGIATLDLTL